MLNTARSLHSLSNFDKMQIKWKNKTKIKKRLHYLCEENTLLELANIYYFIDGEDPKTVSEAFRKKKFEIWDNDIECKSFFLLLSLELTGTLKNTPKEDLLKFMESPIYQSEMEKLKRYL